jgi:hypothetical protein
MTEQGDVRTQVNLFVGVEEIRHTGACRRPRRRWSSSGIVAARHSDHPRSGDEPRGLMGLFSQQPQLQ